MREFFGFIIFIVMICIWSLVFADRNVESPVNSTTVSTAAEQATFVDVQGQHN